jgi:cytosine/adenosine deaminase-related metal-dependent hydrolase
MGLVFCWQGPGSDLPFDEVKLFDTREEAQGLKEFLIEESIRNGTNSITIFRNMVIEEVSDLSEQALAKLAQQYAELPLPV